MATILDFLLSAAGLIGAFALLLGAVVFVHEFGHFFVARICGVKVEVFSIGMGPELFGRTDRHGARWRLSAIPMGGYVRFAGDRNGASVPDVDALEAMPEAERRLTLAGQPLATRAAIVAAGPLASILAAIVVLAGLAYVYGDRILSPRVDAVVAGSPAEQAGFAPGDVVESVNGRAVASFDDIVDIVALRPGETLSVVVTRDGRPLTLVATPALTTVDTPMGPQRVGRLGLAANATSVRIVYPGPIGAIRSGFADSWRIVTATGEYLSRVVVGRSAPDQLAGPVRIAKMSGAAASLGPGAFIKLAAILSLSLGLMNLLPIPMLDGGHLLFYALEAARGRPLSRRIQDMALRLGAAAVVSLMVFVTINDIRSQLPG
ncbi:MAG: RIP metalloprotease RseP [Bradyrhizobium sp.]|nr:MAG: RIP metalloprotease RseP [Bradyrhizobium sp.]